MRTSWGDFYGSLDDMVAAGLSILNDDRPRLETVDAYMTGDHYGPYMPKDADEQYRLLAERSVTNVMPLVVRSFTQGLAVDGYQSGTLDVLADEGSHEEPVASPEWEFWQKNGLDERQSRVHEAAIAFGHSYVVVENEDGQAKVTGLHPLRTTALFADPGNDLTPMAIIHVARPWREGRPGRMIVWDDKYRYEFELGEESSRLSRAGVPHGFDECPGVRFSAYLDLMGRTVGLVEPLIPVQDRLNQTVFDLLVAQTYTSFRARWFSGVTPPMQMQLVRDPDTGKDVYRPVIDPATGMPKARKMPRGATDITFLEKEGARAGSFDATPLGGYIESADAAFRQISALSQVPPHYLLGQIANLSAEALEAARMSQAAALRHLMRSFGESWERVFRLARQVEGVHLVEDVAGEVLWRDQDGFALAQFADAAAKMKDALHVPALGLWPKIPGVTQQELIRWKALYDKAMAADGVAENRYREAEIASGAFDPPEEDVPVGGTGYVESVPSPFSGGA